MVLFPYTIPGHASAWFVTNGINFYRWIATGDKTHYTSAGIGSMVSAPSYITDLTLVGPTPP